MSSDGVIVRYLLEDILCTLAEERLPPPPIAPHFAVDTVRPGAK